MVCIFKGQSLFFILHFKIRNKEVLVPQNNLKTTMIVISKLFLILVFTKSSLFPIPWVNN